MGISVIGGATASSSPIKSIQRGVTTSATTVTISAVNTAKSFVTSFSNASTGNVSGSNSNTPSGNAGYTSSVNFGTDWAAKAFGAYLSSSTQLVTTGAVRWEVIEYV